ncbi:MAG: hypothetical protein AAF215_09090 [Cyanobacteria bacterium P01_A01_bin.123]
MHKIDRFLLGLLGLFLALGVWACDQLAEELTIVVQDYTAIADVTYSWQVEYAESFDIARTIRQETFASTHLTNRNGVAPEGAVTGPDDQGLWWPALPPRPTVDELEARQKEAREKRADPTLLKQVNYRIEFVTDGVNQTAATKHIVYRQVVKAHAAGQVLMLTLTPGQNFVVNAEPHEGDGETF